MSNVSLKEQLQAMVSKISDKQEKPSTPNKAANISSRTSAPKTAPQTKARPQARAVAPKPKWLEHALYGVELLKAYFPHCFLSGSAVKPLKKGIKQDLVKFLSTLDTIVTEDKACMVKSLTYYVNTAAYHKGVVEGASRIDLDGNTAGVVTADEATYSADRQQAKRQAKLASSPRAQSAAAEAATE